MRLLNTVPPSLYHTAPVRADAAVTLRYLGTAGFVVTSPTRTLAIDPFVTRPSLLTTALGRLRPDLERIKRFIPQADDVLIGHAHYDHVLDAPEVCRQTGARFIGSASACNVARAAGLPEGQIRPTRGRERIPCGDATVCGLPSQHGRVYFNRVPYPGNIERPPSWPPRNRELRHGQVLNWYVEIGGVRIMHIDSADFSEQELEGLEVDVLCLCAIGRHARSGYVDRSVGLLKPKVVIACHWDYLFTTYDEPPRLLPGVDLPGFMTEIRRAGAEPVVLPFEGVFGVG